MRRNTTISPDGVRDRDRPLRQRLAAILAADVAGYSRLMGCDERGTVAALDARARCSATTIAAHQGRVDRHGRRLGARRVRDRGRRGRLRRSPCSASSAARAAGLAEDCRMRFRIGIHLGDVMEKSRRHGLRRRRQHRGAARRRSPSRAASASPSRRSARSRNRVAATFDDLGEQRVKNIADAGARLSRPAGGRRRRGAPRRRDVAGARRPPTRERVDKPSIAVLPFNNMSGDPEQEFFADGITEDIITELSRFRELFVISRNSSFKYKGQAVEVQKFARELGVQYVVEGSVRKAGKRVRITVQLIDAETDRHVWAERYDRDLEDIFAIQDEVTSRDRRDAAGARRGRGARPRRAQARPTTWPPTSACSTGKVLHHRSNREDNARALRLLQRAIELDPELRPCARLEGLRARPDLGLRLVREPRRDARRGSWRRSRRRSRSTTTTATCTASSPR